ncbi:MAG: hypothetical protein ACK4PR_13715, partial [Gammaproteobacteria bacterium]
MVNSAENERRGLPPLPDIATSFFCAVRKDIDSFHQFDATDQRFIFPAFLSVLPKEKVFTIMQHTSENDGLALLSGLEAVELKELLLHLASMANNSLIKETILFLTHDNYMVGKSEQVINIYKQLIVRLCKIGNEELSSNFQDGLKLFKQDELLDLAKQSWKNLLNEDKKILFKQLNSSSMEKLLQSLDQSEVTDIISWLDMDFLMTFQNDDVNFKAILSTLSDEVIATLINIHSVEDVNKPVCAVFSALDLDKQKAVWSLLNNVHKKVILDMMNDVAKLKLKAAIVGIEKDTVEKIIKARNEEIYQNNFLRSIYHYILAKIDTLFMYEASGEEDFFTFINTFINDIANQIAADDLVKKYLEMLDPIIIMTIIDRISLTQALPNMKFGLSDEKAIELINNSKKKIETWIEVIKENEFLTAIFDIIKVS